MKILTVVGARPQFIKMAAVQRVLQADPLIESFLLHTGQHYDETMSQVFFDELEIPPPNLNLKIGSGNHGQQTGRMLEAIEQTLTEQRPDYALVYGDTNSTLAGALAAVKLHIPVAHVEAGLRSFNRRMPEEINRVLTDHASDLLFAPTETARENLRREGIPEERIYLTGDVMFDAALYYGEKSDRASGILRHYDLTPKQYILTTLHRAENTDNKARLRALIEGLTIVAKTTPIVLPLHPRTRAALETTGLWAQAESVLKILPPVGYLDMAALEKNAVLIATDSGGVQKEAFFYQTPCVTLRTETEWTELVEAGWNRVVAPLTAEKVSEGILQTLGARGKTIAPYGDGRAAEKIAQALKRHYDETSQIDR